MKKTKEIRNNTKGITLIALVVTIIVLLILAGVSIAMLTGDNGIIAKAQNAKLEQTHAQLKETIELIYGDYQIEVSTVEGDTFLDYLSESSVIDANGVVNVEKLFQGKLSLGNGTGTLDVYKVEKVNEDYQLNYYNKDGNVILINTYSGISVSEKVEPENINDWEYRVEEDGTATLTMYKGSATEVVIPNSIGGIPVKTIGTNPHKPDIIFGKTEYSLWSPEICEAVSSYRVYIKQNKITKVTISEGIEVIENYAFYYSTALEEINLPSTLTSIGDDAFFYCTNLASITIPEGVTSIGNYAFYYCSSLASITIPSSVTSIGDEAFCYCSSLASITIPEGVTNIGDNAFFRCTNLASIEVDEDNTRYDSRNNCNAIIETSTNTLIIGCKNTIIPKGVINIGYIAFYGCANLASITIPEGVTNIGGSAFSSCTNLASITIPSSVTNIGYGAFNYCEKLTTVNYKGTEEQWNEITKEGGNNPLLNATKVYGYTGE